MSRLSEIDTLEAQKSGKRNPWVGRKSRPMGDERARCLPLGRVKSRGTAVKVACGLVPFTPGEERL